jgi:hypothetical protein
MSLNDNENDLRLKLDLKVTIQENQDKLIR